MTSDSKNESTFLKPSYATTTNGFQKAIVSRESNPTLKRLGIPSSFKLFGLEIKVKESPAEETGQYGEFDPRSLEISLFTSGVTDQLVWVTFYHECCHAMFLLSGYQDLYDDERACDIFGSLIYQLHQATKTPS
jgi:hypothetical protein